jgi:hypothetical protein
VRGQRCSITSDRRDRHIVSVDERINVEKEVERPSGWHVKVQTEKWRREGAATESCSSMMWALSEIIQ